MASKSVSAREVLHDFRSGMSDPQLKEKYKLSDKGLLVLFKKMQDAGLITQADLNRRSSEVSAPVAHAPSNPQAPHSRSPSDEFDEKLAQEVVEDVRKGLHNNEIMRRHDLAPNRLKSLLAELAKHGRLAPDEIAARFGGKLVVCPSCSGQNTEGTETCLHCGNDLRKAAFAQNHLRDAAPPPIAPPVAPPVDTSSEFLYECPWEQRESYGLWNAYFQTAMKSLFNPVEFFSKLPASGGYGNPILFAIFSTALSVPISILILTLFGKTGFSVTLIGIVMGFVCALIGAAISTPVAILVWSGLIHGSLHLLQGTKEGFQATFRVTAYSSAPQLFAAIPLLGATVATVYSVILTVIGVRETHQVSTGKSAGAVGIAAGIVLLLALAVYGLKR